MELSREQAILAKEQNIHQNHQLAVKVKKEVNVLLEEREKNIVEKIQENKKVIEEIHAQEALRERAILEKKVENREVRDRITKELDEAAKRLKDE